MITLLYTIGAFSLVALLNALQLRYFLTFSGISFTRKRKYLYLLLALSCFDMMSPVIEDRFLSYLATVLFFLVVFVWNKKGRFGEGLYVSSLSVLLHVVVSYFGQRTGSFLPDNAIIRKFMVVFSLIWMIILFSLIFSLLTKFEDQLRAIVINSIVHPILPYVYAGLMLMFLYLFSWVTDSRLTQNELRPFIAKHIENFGIMVIVFILIFVVYSLYQHLRAEFHYYQKTLESLDKYTDEIETVNRELAMFRHDTINLLSSLELAIKDEDLDALKEAYRNVIKPSKEFLIQQSREANVLNRIQNLEVKSVVYMKYNAAIEAGYNVNLDIPMNVELYGEYDVVVLVRCLTILLDNAIEHGKAGGDIDIAIFRKDDLVFFVVRNAVDQKISQSMTRYWMKPGYTSKGDDKHHGWGLDYVNEVVKKETRFDLDTMVTDERFSQTLIYNNV